MSKEQKIPLSHLRHTIRKMELGLHEKRPSRPVSTGFSQVDSGLPDKGLPFGSVHEITGSAHLAFCLSLLARRADPSPIIWIIDQKSPVTPYAPGLKQHGLNPSDLVFLFYDNPMEAWRFFETALRAGFDSLIDAPNRLDMTRSRRVQLAAEYGNSLGLIVPIKKKTTDKASMNSLYSRWHAQANSPQSRHHNRLSLHMKHCRHARPAKWHLQTPLTLTGYW